MRHLKNFHLVWTKITAMRIFLTLLNVRIGSSFTLLDSNQYFDRIYSSNFGHEIIFYGLRVNYTNLTSFSQQTVQSISVCKTIFRVLPNCLTAFAERQDNGTILCTYTEQPIYRLPTLPADKTKAFVFFKDQNATVPFTNDGGWSYLGSMGKFYIFNGLDFVSEANSTCKRDYPHGHSLRPQTKKDMTTFYGISEKIKTHYYALDLTCRKGLPIWGDGTPLSETETGSIMTNSYGCAYSDGYNFFFILKSSTSYYSLTSSNSYTVVCEVNPFSLP